MDLAQKPVYKLDLAAGTSVVNLTTPLVEGDDRAQTFTLKLTDKGTPANLNGYSVTAYFGRGKTAEAEADTIPLSGTVSGNVATITLTESCYSRSCYFSMPIRLSNGATGQKRTYLIVRGTVVKSVDGTIIDPDGSVPTLDDLFAQIAVMERSRQAAEEATEEALAAAARADEARAGIQDDLATLTQEIDRETAPPIIPTATGEVVTVSDSAHRPLAGLRLYGKTTQNGTPTPNSPVPLVNAGGGGITTRTRGKNLLTLTVDDQNSYGVDVTKTDDGAIVLNGTAAAAALLKIGECNIAYGGYVLSAKGNKSPKSGSVTLLCYDRNGAMRDIAINEHTTSTTFDGYGATNVQVWWAEGTSFDNLRVYPAVEYGNTATGYETYKDGGTLYANIPDGLPGIPVTSGGNYVDEHGQQWICDVRDYGRGVYVQRIGEAIFDGSEDEQWFLQKTIDNTYRLCTNILSNACADHPVSDAASILCNQFVAGSAVHTYVETKTNCIAIQGNGESTLFVYHEDFNTSDMNPWLAHLSRSPMKVYYKLATPIETPIPADELAAFRAMTSHKPNTTVYNDAGAGMAVDYIADTKNYIDKKIAAIAAATLNA